MMISPSKGSLWTCITLIVEIATLQISNGDGHGLLTLPNQRGALSRSNFIRNPVPGAKDTVLDPYMHFPAGVKGPNDAGYKSQIRAAGREGWTPYEPFRRVHRWRFGICGDTLNGIDHLRGGRYYNGGRISGVYYQGYNIDVGIAFHANHHGFMELHVCDVSKCGGEISKQCFYNGHCFRLEQARTQVCQSGRDRRCGPVDRNYPHRFYLGCDKMTLAQILGFQPFGGDRTILFKLPRHLSCDHCVLQWYYVASHRCNAPGLVEYYDGPDAPHWNNCSINGHPMEPVERGRVQCGGRHFPQEFVQCADIQIRRT